MMKLNKNLSNDAAAITSLVAAGVMFAVGILLFVFGAIQGAAYELQKSIIVRNRI